LVTSAFVTGILLVLLYVGYFVLLNALNPIVLLLVSSRASFNQSGIYGLAGCWFQGEAPLPTFA